MSARTKIKLPHIELLLHSIVLIYYSIHLPIAPSQVKPSTTIAIDTLNRDIDMVVTGVCHCSGTYSVEKDL